MTPVRQQAANGNAKVTNLTARIMGNDVGRWLIGLVGLIVIGAGIYRFVKGVTQDVEDELDLSGMSRERIVWTRRLGAVGEIGRGVAIGGHRLLPGARRGRVRSEGSDGLDGALRRLAEQTWGVLVVAVIALGFVAYGVFCLATFTHRRLQAPS